MDAAVTTVKAQGAALKAQYGCTLSAAGIDKVAAAVAAHGGPQTLQAVLEQLLLLDFTDGPLTEAAFDRNLGSQATAAVAEPALVQVAASRDLTQPLRPCGDMLDGEEVWSAAHHKDTPKRLLRLVLTDGVHSMPAVELQTLKSLRRVPVPGEKVLVRPGAAVKNGLLLLEEGSVSFLGGGVEQLRREFLLPLQPKGGGGAGAPKFQPFVPGGTLPLARPKPRATDPPAPHDRPQRGHDRQRDGQQGRQDDRRGTERREHGGRGGRDRPERGQPQDRHNPRDRRGERDGDPPPDRGHDRSHGGGRDLNRDRERDQHDHGGRSGRGGGQRHHTRGGYDTRGEYDAPSAPPPPPPPEAPLLPGAGEGSALDHELIEAVAPSVRAVVGDAFTEQQIIAACRAANYDPNAATDSLLSGNVPPPTAQSPPSLTFHSDDGAGRGGHGGRGGQQGYRGALQSAARPPSQDLSSIEDRFPTL